MTCMFVYKEKRINGYLISEFRKITEYTIYKTNLFVYISNKQVENF